MLQPILKDAWYCARHIFFRIMPSPCITCQQVCAPAEALCSYCMQQILPIATYQMSNTFGYEPLVFAAGRYDGPLIPLITAKYAGNWLATITAADLVYSRTTINWRDYDLLVPVPMYWTKHIYRGFNQAEEIAKHLAIKSALPYKKLLIKERQTLAQAGLKRNEREQNVTHSLRSFVDKDLEGKSVLLIDDLFTTGATIKEAIRALKAHKLSRIDVLVIARAV